MELLMAPLQGFTEANARNAFEESFGGIAEYYTPFIRLEKGQFRNKDLFINSGLLPVLFYVDTDQKSV